MKVKIISNREVSPGLFRLSLEADERLTHGRPGQFVMVRGEWGEDPFLSRPFSVYRYRSSRDAAGAVQILIKRVGKGTELLSRIAPGEELSLQGPLGNGFPEVDGAGRLFLAGGGIGIAPMMAAAESLSSEVLKKTRLIFGGKTAGDVSGIDDDIADVGVETIFVTEDGSRGKTGTVVNMLRDEIGPGDMVFACGPRRMLQAVAALAKEREAFAHVSHEERMACGIGLCLGCAVPIAGGGYALTCKDGPVFDAQSILWEEL